MRVAVELNGRTRNVELTFDKGSMRCTIDGRPVTADAVEVSPGTYSVLMNGQSFEVLVEPTGAGLSVQVNGREYFLAIYDPRQWRRYRGAAVEAKGRQKVLATMPGKVIRVLVAAGDVVEAGQGIFIVEAMKMQNEVRSPKSGIVEQVHVSEGQTVNAGETLGIVG